MCLQVEEVDFLALAKQRNLARMLSRCSPPAQAGAGGGGATAHPTSNHLEAGKLHKASARSRSASATRQQQELTAGLPRRPGRRDEVRPASAGPPRGTTSEADAEKGAAAAAAQAAVLALMEGLALPECASDSSLGCGAATWPQVQPETRSPEHPSRRHRLGQHHHPTQARLLPVDEAGQLRDHPSLELHHRGSGRSGKEALEVSPSMVKGRVGGHGSLRAHCSLMLAA